MKIYILIHSIKEIGGAEKISLGLNEIFRSNGFKSIIVETNNILSLGFLIKSVRTNDVVISFLESSLVYGYLTKFVKGSYWIHSVRNNIKYKFSGFKGLVIEYLMNRSDIIVIPSSGIKDSLINVLVSKVVIRNPVDDFFFNKEIGRQIRKDSIYVGSLTHKKNITELLEFWSRNQIIGKIIGSGPLKDSLYKNYSDFNFLGIAPKEIILKELNNSRIFWLNSLIEGYPNALVEAYQSGIFIICRDIKYGPREILLNCEDYSKNISYKEDPINGFILYTDLNQLRIEEIDSVVSNFYTKGKRNISHLQSKKNYFTQWEKILSSSTLRKQ